MITLLSLVGNIVRFFLYFELNDLSSSFFFNCTYKCIALVNTRTSAISLASLTGEAARRCSDSESDDVIEVSDDEIADDEAADGFDQ